MLSFSGAAASHPGLVRENNEDSGFAGPSLLAVADGVGGAAAGEVASARAVELRRKAMECLLRAGHVDGGLRLIRDVLSSVGLALPDSPKRAVLSLLVGKLRLLLRGLNAKERSADDVAPRRRPTRQ